MGGDHKCPVCHATFTRPQHVARHMRSHTGDRPYKCQHCGDQFARSDLLSRHVKKCHAGEAPPHSAAYRRKGAAASRATTSKQACDQCVQSLLPCDGANPCSKCVQRECQCTFVKFHRQTAPVGPGHNTRSSQPAFAQGVSSAGDFFLGPAPSSTLPTLADTVYSTFPPLYPTSQPSSLPLTDQDFASKYRTQPNNDILRRGSTGQSFLDQRASSATSAWPSHSSAAIDDAIKRQYSTNFALPQHGNYYPNRSSGEFEESDGVSTSSASSSNAHPLQDGDVLMQDPQFRGYQLDPHNDQSQPPQGEGGFSSAFGLMSLDDPAVLAGQATDAQPFFWNVNDIVAPQSAGPSPPKQNLSSYPSRPGLVQRPSTSSGVPYANAFSPSSPPSMRTPSASREAETRELREFWKAYLRTPLSGPFMAATPQGENRQLGFESRSPEHSTNNGGYKRQRVSSLPPVKTPGPTVNDTSNRTLHGNADDLRSYEAAVLARKAPVNLHIVPRRKQNQAQSHQPQQQQTQPPPLHLHLPSQKQSHPNPSTWSAGSRPGSSAGGLSSSLANALGETHSPSPSASSSNFSRESSYSL